MSDTTRSEQACPVCRQHTLAIDDLPRIDVMGVQAYSDMLGMGDLGQAAVPGIVCLSCGTRWRDKDAFDRNDPEPPDEPNDGLLDEPAEDDWDVEGSEPDEPRGSAPA